MCILSHQRSVCLREWADEKVFFLSLCETTEESKHWNQSCHSCQVPVRRVILGFFPRALFVKQVDCTSSRLSDNRNSLALTQRAESGLRFVIFFFLLFSFKVSRAKLSADWFSCGRWLTSQSYSAGFYILLSHSSKAAAEHTGFAFVHTHDLCFYVEMIFQFLWRTYTRVPLWSSFDIFFKLFTFYYIKSILLKLTGNDFTKVVGLKRHLHKQKNATIC